MNLKITGSNPLPNLEPTKSESTIAAPKAAPATIRTNVENAEVNSVSTKKWELSSLGNHVKAKAFSTNAAAAAWPSKSVYSVHQKSVERALGGKIPANDIKVLQSAVKEADDTQYQTLEMSHRHAMTQHGLTKTEARKMANDFVRSELETAKRFQAAGNRPEALRHVGFAMHAMQDATSPAHQGFAVYHGDHTTSAKAKLGAHVVKELYDPGANPGAKSKLDGATEKAYKYFTGELPMPKDFFAGLGYDKVSDEFLPKR